MVIWGMLVDPIVSSVILISPLRISDEIMKKIIPEMICNKAKVKFIKWINVDRVFPGSII